MTIFNRIDEMVERLTFVLLPCCIVIGQLYSTELFAMPAAKQYFKTTPLLIALLAASPSGQKFLLVFFTDLKSCYCWHFWKNMALLIFCDMMRTSSNRYFSISFILSYSTFQPQSSLHSLLIATLSSHFPRFSSLFSFRKEQASQRYPKNTAYNDGLRLVINNQIRAGWSNQVRWKGFHKKAKETGTLLRPLFNSHKILMLKRNIVKTKGQGQTHIDSIVVILVSVRPAGWFCELCSVVLDPSDSYNPSIPLPLHQHSSAPYNVWLLVSISSPISCWRRHFWWW